MIRFLIRKWEIPMFIVGIILGVVGTWWFLGIQGTPFVPRFISSQLFLDGFMFMGVSILFFLVEGRHTERWKKSPHTQPIMQ
ncbi:MAG: hypothetical protein Q7S53_02705 [bacterium]|nr:hypothetical protein [bacterium]